FQIHHQTDHERTVWIDQAIIWFSALRKTIPIYWRWCETKYHARSGDDGTQLADGIAFSVNGHNLILMESSGGNLTEHKRHSHGDTYKLVENSVLALSQIMAAHKDASWSTMKDMQVLSVQTIKDRMTLITTRIIEDPSAGLSWEIVELRNAELPPTWTQVKKLMRVVEVVATAFQRVVAQLAILDRAQDELCGVSEKIKPTVREKLTAMLLE
ncbi:hypothetical protein BDZ88DRAFT_399839, partial [Geranomyces variabilis]